MSKKPQMDKVQKTLSNILKRTDLKLKPSKFLKKTFIDLGGNEQPLKLRYYQVQGIMHLILMKQFIIGDGTGLGKTLESIGALCYLWDTKPDQKVLILTTKSATNQWVNEFKTFTTGINVFVSKGTPKKREKVRTQFFESTGPSVMVMGYRSAIQDFTHLQHFKDFVFITDEATAFKNPKTQVSQVCQHLASNANRVWGLTATLIKNDLMEGYGIYKVIVPELFKEFSYNQFMMYYCLVQMQDLPRSNRKIPVIVGYSKNRVKEFKDAISPYFLGRSKYDVASELPALIMKTIEIDMSSDQEDKYKDALAGLLEIGVGDGEFEDKKTTKLTSIIYCQEIVNDLELIGIDNEGISPKVDYLIELLTDGDFKGEKVIVFSRFRAMVDILMPRLAKAKIKAVRVTGKENEDEREIAKKAFQDSNSGVQVICITTAGSDAINLQAAKALVCYDTPWSAGDFIQLVGRMIRIGSIHDKCYAVHLVSRSKKKIKTIDQRVMEVLGKKMNLIETVLGKKLNGKTDCNTDLMIDVANDISDIFYGLMDDANEI